PVPWDHASWLSCHASNSKRSPTNPPGRPTTPPPTPVAPSDPPYRRAPSPRRTQPPELYRSELRAVSEWKPGSSSERAHCSPPAGHYSPCLRTPTPPAPPLSHPDA